MELTATDIRNHQFATQMRGYDKTEVDTFKEQTAQALEHVKQELVRANMELESVKLQLSTLKQFEDTIKGAAIDARRNADATVATARKEAEIILQKAKTEVETIIATRRQRIAEAEAQMQKAELIRTAFLTKIRTMITSHLELLESSPTSQPGPHHQHPPQEEPLYPTPAPAKPKAVVDPIEVTESTEVRRSRRETVATQPSKPEHGVTEEANAPSHIIPVSAAAAAAPEPDDELAAALRRTFREDAEPAKPSIDPELASALEKYQHGDSETPLGLVGNNEEAVGQAKPEPPSVRPDKPIPSEVLAKELDDVVAKFSEEMDKAAKAK